MQRLSAGEGGKMPLSMFSVVTLPAGGAIPDGDVERLREMGVDGVFPVGSFMGEMVGFIRDRDRRTTLCP